MYGWTAEAVGRAAHQLLGTVFPTPLPQIEASPERHGAWTGDLRQQTRDGRDIVVAAHKLLRRDAQRRAVAVMEAVIDITLQRQAEVALAESNARLRLATANGHIGMVVVTAQHRYLFCNPAYLEIFNIPAPNIVGLRVADVLASVYNSQIKPRLDRACGGERVEYELVRPAPADGRDLVYQITYEPSHDPANGPVAWLSPSTSASGPGRSALWPKARRGFAAPSSRPRPASPMSASTGAGCW